MPAVHHRCGFYSKIFELAEVVPQVVKFDDVQLLGGKFNPAAVCSFQCLVKIHKTPAGTNRQRDCSATIIRVFSGKYKGDKFTAVIGMEMTVKNVGYFENGGVGFQEPPHGAGTGIK